jgi:Protein of unknown function (DUF3303)
MLFIVIERYKNRNATAVYDRFHKKGRMLPAGLNYVSSWVENNFDRCFQLMETEDPASFKQWISEWQDLMEFEVIQVLTSSEASAKVSELSK